VTPATISDPFWPRASAWLAGTHAADALRAFFRYAEQRSWCKPGIAAGILSPRLYVHEGLPEGPQWKDVQRLLERARELIELADKSKA